MNDRSRLEDDNARRAARVTAYVDEWADIHVSAYCSSAMHLIDHGELESARLLHAELTRRFPTRIGIRPFLDMAERLRRAYELQETPCDTKHDEIELDL